MLNNSKCLDFKYGKMVLYWRGWEANGITVKHFTLRLETEIHKDLKVYCASKGVSMQDFIANLVKKELYQKVES